MSCKDEADAKAVELGRQAPAHFWMTRVFVKEQTEQKENSMRTQIFPIRGGATGLLLALAIGFTQMCILAAETRAAEAQTTPLYRYQTKTGLDAYAALPAEIEAYDKLGKQPDDAQNGFIFFRRLMAVGHVYLTKVPGTLPLLALYKDTDQGRRYFYTADIDEAVILQKNGWQPGFYNKGIACYVATKPLPGTIPVYRLQQPDGVDVLYAFGTKERKLVAHLKEERVAFYVWADPVAAQETPKQYDFPAMKADLTVGVIKEVQARAVTFVLQNQGGEKPIPAKSMVVQISAKKADGNFAWFEQQPITQEIKANGATTIAIKTDHDMTGLKINLMIDALNKVEEANEQNNQSGYVDGPLLLVTGVIIQPTLPKLPAPPASAVQDFNLRAALYNNGSQTQSVNTAAKYVTPGKPITLKKSEAVGCEGDTCTFNLGFIVFRDRAEGDVSTYALIRGNTIGSVGNTVSFQNGSSSKAMVFACKLKIGENRLIVEVDPYKKLAETNEQNNSFEVTIIVEP
jgi:hypothetical protein